jgi:predicted DNA-binding protein
VTVSHLKGAVKMKKIKFVKKSFSLPEALYNKLLKRANKEGRTASNMLSEIIKAAGMQ